MIGERVEGFEHVAERDERLSRAELELAAEPLELVAEPFEVRLTQIRHRVVSGGVVGVR